MKKIFVLILGFLCISCCEEKHPRKYYIEESEVRLDRYLSDGGPMKEVYKWNKSKKYCLLFYVCSTIKPCGFTYIPLTQEQCTND